MSKWGYKPPVIKPNMIKSAFDYTPYSIEAGLGNIKELCKITGLSRNDAIKLIIKIKAIKSFNVKKESNGQVYLQAPPMNNRK